MWILAIVFTAAISFAKPQSVPYHLKAEIKKVVEESEKNGRQEFTRIHIIKAAKGSLPTGSKPQRELWARAFFQTVKKKGFQGDTRKWFKPKEIQITSKKPGKLIHASLMKNGGKNWATLTLELEGKIAGRKRKTWATGLLLLDAQLTPFKVIRSFLGVQANDDTKRRITPQYWVDLDKNGFPDLVLKDERYAGAFTLILYFDSKGQTKKQEIHSDAWD